MEAENHSQKAGRPARLPHGIDRLPSGKYRARLRRKGLPTMVHSFDRLEDARGWLRARQYEAERGLWKPTGDAESMTLHDAIKRYTQTVTPSHRGADVERVMLGVILDQPITSKTLASVTRSDVAALVAAWKQVYAIGTNRRLGLLAAVYATARRSWGMPGLASPFAGEKLTGAAKRARRVSDEEIEAWVKASQSPELAAFLRLAVETAMRRGELAGLRWENVDLNNHTAYLPETKNGSSRTVPLSPAAVACLKAIPHTGKRVFNGHPHSYSTAARRALQHARKAYVRECENHGITPKPGWLVDLHMHDLRHEAASRLAPKFATHELAAITGHRDVRMLMRYYHPRAADLAKRL